MGTAAYGLLLGRLSYYGKPSGSYYQQKIADLSQKLKKKQSIVTKRTKLLEGGLLMKGLDNPQKYLCMGNKLSEMENYHTREMAFKLKQVLFMNDSNASEKSTVIVCDVSLRSTRPSYHS